MAQRLAENQDVTDEAGSVSPRPTLSTLDKVADLLRAFVPERPKWKLQEVAVHLGWDKATTHRFLTKLVALKFLERDEEGNFSLGTFVLDLSALYMSATPIRRRLARVMEEVRDRTGLTTQAGYLDGNDLVIALSEEGNTLVKASATLGAHLPLHATAIGKAILSQLPASDVEVLLKDRLPAFTERSLTTRKRVLAEIAAVQDSGLAAASSELENGLDAIAVALPRSVFGVPAGLGCSGPSDGVAARREEAEAALRQAAADVRLAQ